MLRAYGFIEERAKGSHHIFRHPDGRKLTVPKQGGQVVKTTYLKQVLKAIGEEA